LPYTPSSPCITVAFAPNSPAEADDVRDIMTRIAASTGLSISSGPSVAGDIVEFPDKFKLAEWAFDHAQQQVDAAVILSIAPGGRASYELWVNSSLPALYSSSGLDSIWRYSGYSGRLLGLQKELDAGIIGHALGELGVSQTEEGARAFLNHHRRLELLHPFQNEPQGSEKVESPLLAASFSLDSTIAPFEQVDPLSGGVSDPSSLAVYSFGGSFLIMGVVAGSLCILTTVVGEKQRKLLGSLKTIGLLDSTYWLSWLSSYLPLLLGMALVTPGIAYALKIILFLRVEYGVHVLALWLLGTSTAAMSLACAAFLKSPGYVGCTAFCHFAAALSLSIVFNVLQVNRVVYRPDFPFALSFLFMLPWPFFHYGRLISTMMTYILTGGSSLDGNGSIINVLSNQASTPAPFGWKQMEQTPPSTTIYINGLPRSWADKPASFDLGMLTALTFIYIALAMYFGVVSGGRPVYFFLLPSYWGLFVEPPPLDPGYSLSALRNASAAEGSIRIHKLSKSYKQLQALKEVSLTLQPNALTALLGQNGAGKSTLIGLLSGLTEPTHGAMYAMGRDISREIGTLRDVM